MRPTQQTRKTLDIYVVDVEGGNATLFVAPSGESVLIDTGNGGPAADRDADRIMAAVKDAGLTQIDHLITTHWHGDHFGGMAELAPQHSDQAFHRPRRQRRSPAPPADEFLRKVYPTLYAKAKHTVAKPGDKIAVAGLDWRIVAAGRASASRRRCRAPASRIRTARLQAAGRRPDARTRSRSAASSRSASSASRTSAT